MLLFKSRIFFRSFSQENNFVNHPNVIRQLGKVIKNRYEVPEHIKKPHYYFFPNKASSTIGKIEIKNEKQIEGMRKSCKLAANILQMCTDVVKVGITTDEIDCFIFERVIANEAYPSPLRYCGFPKSTCTSVNNIACHGIPDDRLLMDGDIINVDITVFFDGFHGDCSKTFLVGNVDDTGRRLVSENHMALMEAIKICKPGQKFNEIGRVISSHAQSVDFKVCPAFLGHGIGEFFHGPPEVFHFENEINVEEMKPAMTFTIEPIFSEGSEELELWADNWTASTIDGARTSQHEHTILITNDGCEILTVPDKC